MALLPPPSARGCPLLPLLPVLDNDISIYPASQETYQNCCGLLHLLLPSTCGCLPSLTEAFSKLYHHQLIQAPIIAVIPVSLNLFSFSLFSAPSMPQTVCYTYYTVGILSNTHVYYITSLLKILKQSVPYKTKHKIFSMEFKTCTICSLYCNFHHTPKAISLCFSHNIRQ